MQLTIVVLSALLLFLAAERCFAGDAHGRGGVEAAPRRRYSQLWFEPPLSRRKRAPEEYQTSGAERRQFEALLDLIHDSPWAIVAVTGNENAKRYDVNFVPRLGRESGEDGLVASIGGERLLQDPEFVGEAMSPRSPPFAPRLGKRVLPFSPRLGRAALQQPDRST